MENEAPAIMFYRDWLEQVEILNLEQRGALLTVLISDADSVGDGDPLLKMAFGFIYNQIKRDRKKYEEQCQKNRENGKKGGRPKKEKTAVLNEDPYKRYK